MNKYNLLDKLDSKKLNEFTQKEREELCQNLRDFVIDKVSVTGGHLASNLGVVEITVAMHTVFDSAKDRFIFDVGHQSYIHKILTGRKDDFNSLRSFGGLSGFTKPSESHHDAFISGHASTSVSVGLGMARARTLKKEDYTVVSVIGDGALTGGMAYEALCDAGHSKEPLIVILNDNEMSITRNVGAISTHLAKLRLKPRYLNFKKYTKKVLFKIPGGKGIYKFLTSTKSAIKSAVLPASLFEQVGFKYLGPVDGHDLKSVTELLVLAKSLECPVLIHLMTQKGRGYSYSEERPENYHGVSTFDVDTGKSNKKSSQTFSDIFGEQMMNFAEEDDAICAVTAAMQSGTGLSNFANTYENRFFDVGIAEEHAVAMSAAMAKQGLKPVCTLYSSFLQRAYDQLVHDVAIDNINLTIAVDRAGIVGEDGETHNGVFDVGFVRTIPNFTVLCPSSFEELRSMLKISLYEKNSPVVVRYPRGGQGLYTADNSHETCTLLEQGKDITIVSYGIMINNALEVFKIFSAKNIFCDIIKINDITNKDEYMDIIQKSLKKTGKLVVIEDVVEFGSVGTTILSECQKRNFAPFKSLLVNVGDRFLPHGALNKVYEYCNIDAISIVKHVTEALNIDE